MERLYKILSSLFLFCVLMCVIFIGTILFKKDWLEILNVLVASFAAMACLLALFSKEILSITKDRLEGEDYQCPYCDEKEDIQFLKKEKDIISFKCCACGECFDEKDFIEQYAPVRIMALKEKYP
mgnify:CR=1 FL=1